MRHHLNITPSRRAIRAIVALSCCMTACNGNNRDAQKLPLSEMSASGSTGSVPTGLTPLSAAQLDSGNVAFRMRNYESALHFYRTAADNSPQHPAPWYGVYMVAQATKNSALADSATRAVAARNGGGELLDTTVSQTHGKGDAPVQLPPDHPAVKAGGKGKPISKP